MAVLNLLAPAKLNLFLHVTGRRADGYHELQTLFQLLDYGDQVRLSSRADGDIQRISGADQVAAESDLALKAARLLKSFSGARKGCEISIVKQIPVGAGLGGGSSDAAAVMVGLNRIWGLELNEDRLAELGLELGADVPVFVRGRSAWAEGVGERLRPVLAEGVWYLIATPSCAVSTAQVFGSPALTRNTPPLTIDRFTFAESGGAAPTVSWDVLWAQTRNDCEPVTRAMYPQVDEALSWLSKFAEARMTGTGGSVFAPFPDRAEAERVLAQRPDELRAFVTRGLSRINRTVER
jgi:4-diphosphocytidyl-2-C-methyl-D-erythritol kinase